MNWLEIYEPIMDGLKLLFVSLVVFFLMWHKPTQQFFKRWTFYILVFPLFSLFVLLPYCFYLWAFNERPSECPKRMARFLDWWFK